MAGIDREFTFAFVKSGFVASGPSRVSGCSVLRIMMRDASGSIPLLPVAKERIGHDEKAVW